MLGLPPLRFGGAATFWKGVRLRKGPRRRWRHKMMHTQCSAAGRERSCPKFAGRAPALAPLHCGTLQKRSGEGARTSPRVEKQPTGEGEDARLWRQDSTKASCCRSDHMQAATGRGHVLPARRCAAGKAGRRGEKKGEQRRQRVQGGVPGTVHGLCPGPAAARFCGLCVEPQEIMVKKPACCEPRAYGPPGARQFSLNRQGVHQEPSAAPALELLRAP